MKTAAEVCPVVIVGDAVVETISFGVFHRFVKDHFGLRGFQGECCVPYSVVGVIESRSQGMSMSESVIDNPVVRNAEYKFVPADFRKQFILSSPAFVGSVIEIKQVLQVLTTFSDSGKNVLSSGLYLEGMRR